MEGEQKKSDNLCIPNSNLPSEKYMKQIERLNGSQKVSSCLEVLIKRQKLKILHLGCECNYTSSRLGKSFV